MPEPKIQRKLSPQDALEVSIQREKINAQRAIQLNDSTSQQASFLSVGTRSQFMIERESLIQEAETISGRVISEAEELKQLTFYRNKLLDEQNKLKRRLENDLIEDRENLANQQQMMAQLNEYDKIKLESEIQEFDNEEKFYLGRFLLLI